MPKRYRRSGISGSFPCPNEWLYYQIQTQKLSASSNNFITIQNLIFNKRNTLQINSLVLFKGLLPHTTGHNLP